ncbi:hypothetical protein [Methylopila sp. M107]|uniref:hypothetical protein n=1 Tax=Methylopila sp. M107 TaxID=1101190 RepID=UPI0012DD2007|nr:hypothetical protein [Methylopila sp. M107]
MPPKLGDQVRVAAAPDGLDAEAADIRALQATVFQIVGFENGLAKLLDGEGVRSSSKSALDLDRTAVAHGC